RYRVWHRFRNEEYPLPMILFLGGASGVGKSSVGVALANQLKISRLVSTDSIRQIMRLMIAPDLIPALHESSYAAWEKVPVPSESADPVISAYREQAGRVCVGVRAMIERAIEEHTSLIVDGVHLLPELIDLEAYADQALFFWVNLYLSDEDLYRLRFRNRSEQAEERSSHRYLEYLESILKIQQHLLEVGDMYKVPAVENIDFDETVQLISLQIMDFLRDKVSHKVLVPK
ncbi:MAG: AAA family ATPase, partial [bacterium]|nr:AAA family ATPase [bacterium]